MKVFITGGSGFVGRQIIRDLLAQNHKVRCLVRPPSRGKLAEWEDRISIIEGDIFTHPHLEELLSGYEAVIHLIGIIREFKSEGITFQKVHVEATERVLNAAKKAGVNRFLHMSALGARPRASCMYHITKYAAEELVKSSGLSYTIFRPSIIYGKEDHFVNLYAAFIRNPLMMFIPVIGDGNYRVQPVAVEHVSQGFVRALKIAESRDQIFHVAGPQAYSFNQILDEISQALGKGRKAKLHLPLFLARTGIKLFGEKKFFPLSEDMLTILLEENVTQGWKKFYELFGIEPELFPAGLKRIFSSPL